MCGICGIIGRDTANNERYVEGMMNSFLHRGPDSEGAYRDKDICMGVRRLSIIDLFTGEQPIYNEDKNLVLIFNGEIYNQGEIRQELKNRGHIFSSNTDCEVIVHLFEEMGKECLRRLKGMFSFALWDKKNRVLFAARDRFGIKPLYFYNKDGVFCFSSELRGLADLPFVEKKINREALDLYFSLEYVPSPHSIIEDIHKLRPAHYLLVKDGKVENVPYWRLSEQAGQERISVQDAQEKTLFLLRRSVKQHLESDVPLGVFLSGGIDSTVLAYLASLECPGKVSTYTIGFKEKGFDESSYAAAAAEHIKTEHHVHTFTLNHFLDIYKSPMTFMDEPFADMSIFPFYLLAKDSSDSIKAALSGEGGDEIFMGYPTYPAHKYANYFDHLPDSLKSVFCRLASMLPSAYGYFSLDFKIKKFWEGISGSGSDPVKRHLEWMGAFLPAEKDRFFTEDARSGSDALQIFIDDILRIPDKWNIYKKVQYLDIHTYLSEDLLVKADRAGMASSLELRVPYLDHELVEFLWRQRPEVLYQKKLLRHIFKGKIPHDILSRKKKGFAMPFSRWLRTPEFMKVVEPYFDDRFIEQQGIFNPEYIKKIMREHIEGRIENRKRLGAYIMFQKWYESFF